MALKHSVRELMNKKNLTSITLAAKSGVSAPTVRRALDDDNQRRINTTSATAIAAALGSSVGDINWPGGLANEGRPARSGGSYTRHSA